MAAFLTCRACFRVFDPPGVPEECPACGATDADVEDAPLWSRTLVVEQPEDGGPARPGG